MNRCLSLPSLQMADIAYRKVSVRSVAAPTRVMMA